MSTTSCKIVKWRWFWLPFSWQSRRSNYLDKRTFAPFLSPSPTSNDYWSQDNHVLGPNSDRKCATKKKKESKWGWKTGGQPQEPPRTSAALPSFPSARRPSSVVGLISTIIRYHNHLESFATIIHGCPNWWDPSCSAVHSTFKRHPLLLLLPLLNNMALDRSHLLTDILESNPRETWRQEKSKTNSDCFRLSWATPPPFSPISTPRKHWKSSMDKHIDQTLDFWEHNFSTMLN